MIHTQWWMWLIWAMLLIAQNFAFTFVSRARNSGALSRHIKAALLSNGCWFLSQIITVKALLLMLHGGLGFWMDSWLICFYTMFTVIGSITAHAWALKNEKGKSAVGANTRYAQIPIEEWEHLKHLLTQQAEYIAKQVDNHWEGVYGGLRAEVEKVA